MAGGIAQDVGNCEIPVGDAIDDVTDTITTRKWSIGLSSVSPKKWQPGTYWTALIIIGLYTCAVYNFISTAWKQSGENYYREYSSMSEEPNLIMSPLSQELSSGGRTVNIDIYKLETDKGWTLEIVDEFNNSTVWDDTFETESMALVEAKKSILEVTVSHYIGPEDGKGDSGEWR